jgi:SHS family lactate transporter-like MFS transporter
MILPAIAGIVLTPLYLFTRDYTMIVLFFGLQGLFAAGGIFGQNPSYLSERFPTEVRATAAGFCYHQGAIFGGLTAPVIAFLAVNWHLGFAIPMAIGTLGGLASFIVALLLGPETRGKHLTAELGVAAS